jgi:hypothetical protein
MTASRTGKWLLDKELELDSPESVVFPEAGSFVEVCWRMEILVLVGMPGMSFSATAFKIAIFGYQFRAP